MRGISHIVTLSVRHRLLKVHKLTFLGGPVSNRHVSKPANRTNRFPQQEVKAFRSLTAAAHERDLHDDTGVDDPHGSFGQQGSIRGVDVSVQLRRGILVSC